MTGIATGLDSFSSPFNRVQATLQRDTAAGSISATDETALTSALGDIQTQLTAGATAAAGSAATAATTGTAAPASMADRVNSLIDGEVSSGKLTADQATELKGAFQQVHAHMHGMHGHHGGGGGGGLDGILATLSGQATSDDGQTAADASTTNGTSTNPVASAATTAVAALESFITQFKSAVSSNALYGATGTSGAGSATSLLVNAIG